jgi:transposase
VYTWRLDIPPHTALAARSAYDLGDPYLLVGDRLACWLQGLSARSLSATFLHEPRWSDLVLALVTVFQYVEHLPDCAAADAVRTRLDWKYALHLPLDHPGIEYLALGSFRQRLLDREADRLAFQCLLDWLTMIGFLGGEHTERKALYILEAVDALAWVHEATQVMSEALGAVATLYPDWLRQIALPHWYQRYGHPSPDSSQTHAEATSACLVDAIQSDAAHLLEMVRRVGPPGLAVEEIGALHRLWRRRT